MSLSSTYIPISTLTAPDFSPHNYANSLVTSVNTSTTELVDLTTPLQKTLFDLQEIDTSIHTLTTRNALPILEYTSTQNATAQRLLARIEDERSKLVNDFERLKVEVLGRYERAENARLGAERSLHVTKLLRGVQRVLGLGRRFEALKIDGRDVREAADVVLEFKKFMGGKDELARVNVVKQVRGRVFEDGEARVLDWAKKVVREFSTAGMKGMGSEDGKTKFKVAVDVLYVLSPAKGEYLITALQGYLSSAVTSSAASIGRGLREFPTLERALAETSARCQNVLGFERLLGQCFAPRETAQKKVQEEVDEFEDREEVQKVEEEEKQESLLQLLLTSLDTESLPSWFWRSLAAQMGSKVQEILNRGGVSARTLRSNKEMVRNEIRDCVLRGSRMPSSFGGEEIVGNWEREAAVMTGSILGPLR